MDNKEIKVFYPTWLKILMLLFCFLMIFFSIIFLSWPFAPSLTTDWSVTDKIVFSILGIGFLYMFIDIARCIKYFSTVLVLTESGVCIRRKGVSTDYLWDDLDIKSNRYAVKVRSKSGKTLAYFGVSDGVANLDSFVETIEHKTA